MIIKRFLMYSKMIWSVGNSLYVVYVYIPIQENEKYLNKIMVKYPKPKEKEMKLAICKT